MTRRALRLPTAPLLEIPAAQEILRLDARTRGALRKVLLELRLCSREDGDRAWRKRKGPMAAYRHDVARHAGLLARALCLAGEGGAPAPPSGRFVAESDAYRPRSSRAAVRNPLLRLAGTAALQRLPELTRGKLRVLLRDLARACGDRAERCWSRRERADALYWRTAAVYAGHLARALAGMPAEQCELPLADSPGRSPALLMQPCEEKPSPSGSNTRCSSRGSGSAPPPPAARSIPGNTLWRAA